MDCEVDREKPIIYILALEWFKAIKCVNVGILLTSRFLPPPLYYITN